MGARSAGYEDDTEGKRVFSHGLSEALEAMSQRGLEESKQTKREGSEPNRWSNCRGKDLAHLARPGTSADVNDIATPHLASRSSISGPGCLFLGP